MVYCSLIKYELETRRFLPNLLEHNTITLKGKDYVFNAI